MKSIAELQIFIEANDIEFIEDFIEKLKETSRNEFLQLISLLKIIFINEDNILTLNKIALVFNTFKIYSATPLIVSKLLSEKHNHDGGTLVYSLQDLRCHSYLHELKILFGREISYEMVQMLKLLFSKQIPDN